MKRLDWDGKKGEGFDFDEWKYWEYLEQTKQQFEEEELIALITKEHALAVPDQFDIAEDSGGQIWVVYRANDGDIWLASPNLELNDWVFHERILYVPSGSTNPTIVFDKQDRHIIGCEFLPAGSDQTEIWLYEPPYFGAGIRRIAQGQYPVLARDVHGEVFLFYQAADRKQILYRKSSNNFTVDYPFESSEEEELQPRGFRALIEQISSIHQRYTHLMFYQEGEGELPLYKMTRPIDLVKIKQTYPLYTNFSQPSIEWEGIKYIDLLAKAGDLHTSFGELGLEWEDMRTGMQVLVYSGVVAQEFTGLLSSPNDLWISIWNPTLFTVSGTTLTITGPTDSSSMRCVINESAGESTDCTIISKVRTTNATNNQLRLYLRTQNDSNGNGYYAELFNGESFRIRRYIDGVSITFPITFSWSADTDYWIKFQAEGNNLRAKVWEDGGVEPGWLIEVVDDTFESGYAGVGSFTGWGVKTFENISITGTTYIDVPVPVGYATVQLGDQHATTNQDGLAEFFDLDGNQLYDYTISHPDFEGVSKGTILIPEEERDFIPVRIYNNPWDGMARGRIQTSLGDVSTLWHQVEFEEIQARAGVKTNASLQSILWVEVESE